MAASFVGGEVATNGTTAVTAVSAPGASKQRQVLSVICCNKDTVDHTFIGQKNKAAALTPSFQVLVGAGLVGQLILNGCVVLDATDESYEVKLGEAITTTQPVLDVGAFEVP